MSSILYLLWQDEIWVTRDGTQLRVEEMDASHAQNVVNLLERRAPQLLNGSIWAAIGGPQPSGDGACDEFEAGIAEAERMLEAGQAEEWLWEHPLLQALIKRTVLV
jgi:hypothetical protein